MNATVSRFKQHVTGRIKANFQGYPLHEKFYLASVYILGGYVFASFIAVLIFRANLIDPFAKFSAYLIAATCTVAVVIEYWATLKALYEKTWFKWALGIIGVLAFKYSEQHANGFINDFTGIDPGYLPAASSTLTTLFVLYSWLLAVSSFLAVFMLLHWAFVGFEKPKGERQLRDWKYIARFVGLFVIFIITSMATRTFEERGSLTAALARQVVLSTEYFKKSHCTNISPSQRSANLSDGLVSVYQPESNTFDVVRCEASRSRE